MSEPLSFRKVEQLFFKHLALESDPTYLRVIFGTVVANRMDSLPVWILVIGEASSGKSEVATSLAQAYDIYPMSCLNKNALISHAPKKGKDDEGIDDNSLLPKLNGKVLLITDISTMSTMHPNDKAFIFGQLRSAFDGELSKASGMGQTVHKSKFGIIACATPIFEHQRTFEGALGERFVYFRPCVCSDMDVYEKVKNSPMAYTAMKKELTDISTKFFDRIKAPTKIYYHDDIIRLAQTLAVLRTESIRSSYGNHEKVFPSLPEKPIRLTKQLSALYTGIRSFCPEREALQAVKRVMKDSVPYLRLHILKSILTGKITIKEIVTVVKVSEHEIRRQLEDLVDLGVLSRMISIKAKGAKYIIDPIYEDIFKVSPIL